MLAIMMPPSRRFSRGPQPLPTVAAASAALAAAASDYNLVDPARRIAPTAAPIIPSSTRIMMTVACATRSGTLG